MGTRLAWHDAWFDVDNTTDPSFFIQFLDMTRAPLVNAIRADPEGFRRAQLLEPGLRVLDVGCGTGHFARWFAEGVGAEGRVTGLDNSHVLVGEARRRAEGLGLPLEYVQGDAHRLPFADDTFDRCYATIVLEHVEEPRRVLAELVRVTKPGGWVVAVDNDFNDPGLTQQLTPVSQQVQAVLRRTMRHGGLARQLPRMFVEEGLSGVKVEEVRQAFESLNPVVRNMIQGSVDVAVREERVTAAEGEAHMAELARQDAEGRFRMAWHTLKVMGQKPFAER